MGKNTRHRVIPKLSLFNQIPIKVYGENKPIKPIGIIVDKTSVDPGRAGITPIILDRDHISICKPESKSDRLYLGVKQFIEANMHNNPSSNSNPSETQSNNEQVQIGRNNSTNFQTRVNGGKAFIGDSITINNSINKFDSHSQNSSPQRTILVLAASPTDMPGLRLDKEIREIDNGLRLAKQRDNFNLEQRLAIRTEDLRRALLQYEPQIVHFCGHGKTDGIFLENNAGTKQLVSKEALTNLFKLFSKRDVQCVVLNACYSDEQAEEISEHINFVVGMSRAIGDQAAIQFAVGFYDALGAGWSYEEAYKLGCNAITLEGIPEELTPVLKKKLS